MTDRRSGRAKKTIDYSKFGAGDSDNDDDFRESNTQPIKRKKNESSSPKSVKVKLTKVDAGSYKIEAKKTEKKTKGNEDEDCAPKKRLPLSDKVFQRHLSEALEISKQGSEAVSSKSENTNGLSLNEVENDEAEMERSVANGVNSITTDKSLREGEPKGNKSRDDDNWNDASSSESEEDDDASDWSDEDKETEVKKPAVKGRKSRRNDDEEDESDSSDDDDRKKKSKKPAVKKREPKKQPKNAVTCKTSQTPKSVTPKYSKPTMKISGSSTVVSPGLKPSVKTPGTPCQVISSPVKLPPKGIRLGLSRKVSGKPLHSVIKVQQ